MKFAQMNRRALLSGVAGFAMAGSAHAEDDASPIAHGVLANNPLAKAFKPTPAKLPDVLVISPSGSRQVTQLLGRTLLMPLWAEWCTPCLSELQDFATLQKNYGNDKFAIVPILSGTQKRMTPDTIAKLFSYLHADVFEPLAEAHFGEVLLSVMARGEGHEITVPCNVLIAPDGRVIAREIGMKQADDNDATRDIRCLLKPRTAKFSANGANRPAPSLRQQWRTGFLVKHADNSTP